MSAQMRMLTNKLPITIECNNKHLTQTFTAKGVCLEEVTANTNAKVYMELGKKDKLASKERCSFLLIGKNLCRYPEEKTEGISKIKSIKVLTGPVLEFGFFIRSKENFKDGVT